ncbi:MBL fold metallo-hydrolase [Streptomyces spiroverticillatus]|uniref:MBL fold metallo-hydrolase n=1 Tax=Streptomyces finlayi TaxID=67296 RepID=A0A918WV49_9ACTN|nr:MBL fold metallo-hydrolase [Streptomyces finlayi]GHA01957.1 MBL fold metallo-hydrolase [Streptomyces spiroverticillatus]GHC86205.1 MBL fold metallo-hydrolase [Streptomyces finlayi]
MRLTKYTHSCIRLEREDLGVLVVDPGTWSEPEALRGADAVLITHEHADHIDPSHLQGLDLPLYAPKGAALPDLDFTEVTPNDTFTAAGFRITTHGGTHARIYGDLPDCANLGYLIEGSVYHPGDSLHVPSTPVETLLVPLHAPWMRLSESIDFTRTVNPSRALGIHDAQLNPRGLASANGWLEAEGGTNYRYLEPGSQL